MRSTIEKNNEFVFCCIFCLFLQQRVANTTLQSKKSGGQREVNVKVFNFLTIFEKGQPPTVTHCSCKCWTCVNRTWYKFYVFFQVENSHKQPQPHLHLSFFLFGVKKFLLWSWNLFCEHVQLQCSQSPRLNDCEWWELVVLLGENCLFCYFCDFEVQQLFVESCFVLGYSSTPFLFWTQWCTCQLLFFAWTMLIGSSFEKGWAGNLVLGCVLRNCVKMLFWFKSCQCWGVCFCVHCIVWCCFQVMSVLYKAVEWCQLLFYDNRFAIWWN